MKKIINKIAQSLLLVPVAVLGLSVSSSPAAFAVTQATGGGGTTAATGTGSCDTSDPATLTAQSGANCAQNSNQPSNIFGDGGIFTVIVNILLFIIGAIAVIMLIVGGIRYVLSGGDQAQITAAKNTIMYAIIGIIIAILAYAIVNFVLGVFAPK